MDMMRVIAEIPKVPGGSAVMQDDILI
jgi:hypothetical protein